MNRVHLRCGLALFFVMAFLFVPAWAQEKPGLAAITAELGTSATYALGLYSDGTGSLALPGMDWSKPLSIAPWFSLDVDAKYFEVVGRLSGNTDGKYGAALVDIPGGHVLGSYFTIDEGGIRSQLGALRLSAGRFRHYDAVESPYSLFVNGRGVSAPLMSIAYDDGLFFYESRWVELNSRSDQNTPAWPTGFPDRGAEYKSYGFHIGDMRIGLQDAAVYVGQSFDGEYFIDPLPMYFSQYLRGTGGAPWSDGRNDNSIIGFFWDWKRNDGLTFMAQLLVDDVGFHWLIPSWPDNPNKLAFSLGARMDTGFGSFGLFAAGATRYTFEGNQLTGADLIGAQQRLSYSYTYYPDTRYDHGRDYPSGSLSGISIEDNLLGYVNGENNLALRLDWKGRAADFDLASYIEFRLAGENSPTNPYHDLQTQGTAGGTQWLNDPVLEKRFLLDVYGSRKLGALKVFAEVLGGVAVDAMRLRAPSFNALWSNGDNYSWIYTPVSGQVDPLLMITLGASYALGSK